MMFRKIAFLGFALLLFSSISFASASQLVEFESHKITLILDVPNQSATVIDQGQLIAQNGSNLFLINQGAVNIKLSINGTEVGLDFLNIDSSLSAELQSAISELEPGEKAALVKFDLDTSGMVIFELGYTAVFNDDVENARFSNENVGREVSGTILEKGAYLSPASYYYPQGFEDMCSFQLTAIIPNSWESIADGNLVDNKLSADQKIQSWKNPFKNDGLMFFAAPFVTKSTMVDSIEVACYFFPEDSGLIDDYLSTTADYIRMYNELIGPYPFERFTVVENFFPTGYGMPAWTLLGQQVLRLPFIKYTSLGHEVLHNWWGNSVYVDYDRGNWCESATVYGADYRYKFLRSESSAKAYRKDILKQYVSYVTEGNDFPIREFKSRTSANTRTIGYNKAMMVWHFIHERIGDEAFFGAWKDVYHDYIGKKISWEEWIAAFENRCECDLSYVIPQWIDNAGAPELAVELISIENDQKQKMVTFSLKQSSTNQYNLLVPIRFSNSNKDSESIVSKLVLNSEDSVYTYVIPEDYTDLSIDPDYHLFRKLYPEEIEPIVSSATGADINLFIDHELDSISKSIFLQVAQNIDGEEAKLILLKDLGTPNDTTSLFVLNPAHMPDYLTDLVVLTNDTIFVDGIGYPRDGHTVVASAKFLNGFEKCLVFVSDDLESLPRIGQLVPHYGKYSYLVFKGARNIAKGQWEVNDSPLRIELR